MPLSRQSFLKPSTSKGARRRSARSVPSFHSISPYSDHGAIVTGCGHQLQKARPTLPGLTSTEPGSLRKSCTCECPPTSTCARAEPSINASSSSGVVAKMKSSWLRGDPWKASIEMPGSSSSVRLGTNERMNSRSWSRRLPAQKSPISTSIRSMSVWAFGIPSSIAMSQFPLTTGQPSACTGRASRPAAGRRRRRRGRRGRRAPRARARRGRPRAPAGCRGGPR